MTMLLSATQSVVFTFTNAGTLPATNVKPTFTYPPGFTQTSNTCGTTLAASVSYQVTAVGPIAIGVMLSYAEGSDVSLQTSATVKKKFVYVVNEGNNTVSLCTVDPNTDQLRGCADAGASSVFHIPTTFVCIDPLGTSRGMGGGIEHEMQKDKWVIVMAGLD
jgi:hypothetical protein